jgi:two-component system CAI-1 autoinducer sensor kinase/phosphatase CqsS
VIFFDFFKEKLKAIADYVEPNLAFLGLLGAVGFPLYFLMWAYAFPQTYENLELRLLCSLLFLPWVFHRALPSYFRSAFFIYFFISSFFVMPFFFSFMTLKNEFSVVWSMSFMAGLFLFIIVIYDWIIICLLQTVGFLFAYLLVLALDGQVSFRLFQLEYLPIYAFSLVGGIIFNYRRQTAQASKMTLMEKLGGSIAHEMRNPLGTIINAMDTFRGLLPQKSELEFNLSSYSISRSGLIHLHQAIEQNTAVIQRGNKIIDAILTSMKNENLSTHDFLHGNIKDAIHTAIESFGYDRLEDKSLIQVRVVQDFSVFYDKDLFIYVLFNLIKNSLYYKNKEGFQIEIAAAPGSEGDYNWIRVKDNGPGIPANKLETIFEGFYTSGKKGGTGLGLSFCRRVLESFGGSIRCRSYQAPAHEPQNNNWTEFLIKLPKYESKSTRQLQQQILSEKRILIVDDQNLIRTMVKKHLSIYQCQVDEAINGQEALDMMAKTQYDLVFMDIEMPVMRGDEAIESLRSGRGVNRSLTSRYKKVPLITVSSLNKEEHQARLLSIGVSAVLEKPLQPSHIAEVFEEYFFRKTAANPNGDLAYERWSQRLKDKHILLVDDSQASRMFIPIFLQSTGCYIRQASNGKEAIDLMDEYDFDIVLMDMEMPVLGGLEATRLIRSGKVFLRFKGFKEIPIIALTGNTDQKTIESIKEAGMNDHLGKPATRDQLVEMMATWLASDPADGSDKQSNLYSDLNASGLSKPTLETPSKPPSPYAHYSWQQLGDIPILDELIVNDLKQVNGLSVANALIGIFLEEVTGQMEELSTAYDTQNVPEVSRLSHTIKGSAGTVGAIRMEHTAELINASTLNNTLNEIPDWLVRFKDTYTATKQALEQN